MPYRRIGRTPDAIAPDGSEVRLLLRNQQGSMAHFTLEPGSVSMAVAHRTVEELWYFTAGSGQMVVGDEVFSVERGISVHIPVGLRFQFRSDGEHPLEAVAVTMPPWPGDDEATPAPPYWSDGPDALA